MLVLMLEVFQREADDRQYLSWVSALGFAATALAAFALRYAPGVSTFHGMNYLDGYSLVLTHLFCFAGAATSLVAPRYLREHGADRGEFHALLLFAVGGMMLMVSAADFVVLFIALEIMSIAVYALAAYVRRSAGAAEAGMKYFLLGAFASAILLYGIALIYGATGTTNFEGIRAALTSGGVSAAAVSDTVFEAIQAAATGASLDDVSATTPAGLSLASMGILLVMVAFAFKIAAVPFHMWAPDAYTGAPTPVVGFMAAAVKAAGVAALLRLVSVAFFAEPVRMGMFGWVQIAFGLAMLSMIVGNLVAIVQDNVKRMLAYSSVAHAGYLLVGFVAVGYGVGNINYGSALVFYLFAYTFATVGAFGALAWLGRRGHEVERYEDLNGLGYRYPWIGLVLGIFMLSSAGIPPAAGFIGKFLVFKAAIGAATTGSAAGFAGSAGLILLVTVGILVSIAGVYYYLRVIVHLFMKPQEREVVEQPFSGAKLAIAACAVLTIVFGLVPGRLIDASDRAVTQMAGRADGVYMRSERPAPRAEAPLTAPATDPARQLAVVIAD
mgnify:FL=1